MTAEQQVLCTLRFFGTGSFQGMVATDENLSAFHMTGSGTRKGSGKCACDAGYSGEVCDTCTPGYFADVTDKGEPVCTKCHQACKGNCTEPGPKACAACNEGFVMTEEFGCLDVDECVEAETPLCGKNTFCANNEGSYKCMDCDFSCNGCTGDGPDMCVTCAEGYVLKDKVCVGEAVSKDDGAGEEHKDGLGVTQTPDDDATASHGDEL
ncbi:hypothetical protein ISCGN_024636 [Ixodes scapularis]